jgi:hypothetical protein
MVSVVSAIVDVVWTEGFSDPEAAVWYRRSTNSGATWGTAVRISPPSSVDTGGPAVVRQGNTVLVSYTDRDTGAVHFRRSIDGGATWQNVRTLGVAGSPDGPGASLHDGWPSMTFGSGVLYAVWRSEPTTVNLRRSFDGGLTWTAATALANDGSAPLRITVSGSEAMLTFTRAGASSSHAAFRKTSDKGSHWAPAQRVSGGTRNATAADVLYAAGRYRIVYRQCLDDACDSRGLLYRESVSGSTWTWPVRFTITGHAFAEPMGIGHTAVTGKTWLGWTGFVDFQSDVTVFVRSVQ